MLERKLFVNGRNKLFEGFSVAFRGCRAYFVELGR